MSGGREFSEARLNALAEYIWSHSHMDATRLQLLVYTCDIDAYRRLGKAITGATYVKGERLPEIKEVPREWFCQFVKARTPRYARGIGWLVTASLIVTFVRQGREAIVDG